MIHSPVDDINEIDVDNVTNLIKKENFKMFKL